MRSPHVRSTGMFPRRRRPPLSRWPGDDQAVTPENSLLYYRALMDNRVPASLHIYPEGGTRFRVQRYVPL